MAETTADGTTTWRRRWGVGRLQLGYRLYRHRSLHLPDRWVVCPELVYDRKRLPMTREAIEARQAVATCMDSMSPTGDRGHRKGVER